jgi:hypothetical protein
MKNKNIVLNDVVYLNKLSTDNNIRLVCQYIKNGVDGFTTNSIPLGVILKNCYLEISSGVTINNATIKPMLTFNARETEYEPPKAKQTLTMPYTLRSVGEVKDEVDFARGVRTPRFAEVDLGTLSWVLASNGKQMTALGLASEIAPLKNNDSKANLLCSAYTNDTANNIWDCKNDKTIAINASSQICVYDSNYTDATSFKNAMNGVKLVYELKTPIETPISETELNAYRHLYTNKGNTTILSEADMEVDYYINKPNAQAIGSLHEQINKDYIKLQQAIISTGGNV